VRAPDRRRRGLALAFTVSAVAGVVLVGDFDSGRSTARSGAITFGSAAPTAIQSGSPKPTAPIGPSTIVVANRPRSRPSITLSISQTPYGHAIAPGFVGLSLEYYTMPAYLGRGTHAINPLLAPLIRALAPGQSPVLRIGGDSTDWTWAPTPGLSRPPGIRFTLTRDWISAMRALVRATDAHLILGINLEANRPALAATEARMLTSGIGRRHIAAFELGNEPELYGSFGWYRTRQGLSVPGRPPSYDYASYARDVARTAAELPALPLAGPAIGGQQWIDYTGPFVANTRRLRIVTLHRYALQRCYLPAISDLHPTIPHLLADAASAGLATGVAQYAAIAHARGLPLRIDEINSVSCGGARGVSNTFAAALWALNTMFELASVGVDGVNVHTFARARYGLFSFSHRSSRWRAHVAPEYYGLMLFARAAPPNSRLLAVRGARPATLNAWATQAPDRQVRVILINDSASRRETVALKTTLATRATLIRLQAPALNATAGITLDGQRFATNSTTALLAGRVSSVAVSRSRYGYVITVPPASAAMLTAHRAA
jgi:hypothetical protein